MRWLIGGLLGLLLLLQYRLWFAEGGLAEANRLQVQLEEAQAQIAGGGDAEEIWRLEVWQKMLLRIRKMQELMKDKPDPNA